MTLAQTRQLGIEVERRLQTILPTLKLENKIDTEDIYAFLNQFQKQYIDMIYRQDDEVESNTRTAMLVEDIIRTITKHSILNNGVVDSSLDYQNKIFDLPNDYYQYIRSTSKINSSYNSQSNSIASNVLLKQSDVDKIINQYYDKNRILRNPVAVLEDNKLKIVHDVYTDVTSVDITYIKLPNNFSVLTNTPCELPIECFETLVSGAVELYINHLTATQPKQQRKEVKDDKD